ncbi:GRB2-associated-binding protein 3 [Anabarilius grahami]|uniref:GRB2-associated-binding protein 3 n=1 Tax=Anabarilius grahami TaxID=495550 RepID=A0A3N0XHC1_ANAGA|nr:GRB2-associated-binding protein 3 [Anabarilius grahami]
MSGNPDVLEYYRSKSSRKPIRTIDLQECEVTIEAEVRPTKRQYQNQHLFVVKTTTRIFYLLAKTAEEMNVWVQNIGQICTFGGLNRHAESMDSLNHTPSSQQPSPALSPHVSLVANQDTVTIDSHAVLDRTSESEISPPLDYLFLSQCETVHGADEKGYTKLPLVEEAVAVHLCLPMAIGWKTKASHPSKPCRTTSALASRAFATDGQAASALHTIAVQIYQPKLLSDMNESGPDPAKFKELRNATDLVLCDSISNSERSFEQSSSEYTEDVFSPTPRIDSSPFLLAGVSEPPFSAPCGPLSLSSSLSSCLSSPISLRRPPDIFRFDRPFCVTSDPQTPPPLPPKPTHLSDHPSNDDTGRNQTQPALLPRRTSLSGIDHFRKGEFDNTGRNWNKRLSLNLPIFLNTTVTENHCEDSYVPMASPPISCSNVTSDGYIPMSPSTLPVSLLTNGKTELPSPSNPDLEPPPVDRNLKPKRPKKVRPPPLDLRGLSTISECPFHVSLTRTMTEPSTSLQCVPLDRRRGWGSEQEGSITPTDSRQMLFPACDSTPWMRPSQLDYLSLDFNSASPSPVQKKPLLADEYRVDYVQVDEKKTQALQSTKMEWKDVRQSKA